MNYFRINNISLVVIVFAFVIQNEIHAQSIYFPQNPQKLSNSLDLVIQTTKQINYPVYISINITDVNGQIFSAFNTPSFEIQMNNIPIKKELFEQLYFSIGNKNKLEYPPHGKYNIEAALVNISNQQKIAQSEISIWIDSSAITDSIQTNKASFIIQNTSEINLPKDTLSLFRNYNRTDISGRYQLKGIPLISEIGITKDLFQKNIYIDHLSFSLDRSQIEKQLQQKRKEIEEDILNSNDTAKIREIINHSYSNYTGVQNDWFDLLQTYQNDSIRKTIQQIQNIDSNNIKNNISSLKKQSVEIQNEINHLENLSEYQKTLSQDSLFKTYQDSSKIIQKKINELNYILKNKEKQIASIQNDLINIEKYKNVIANKDALDSIYKKDPEKIIQNYISDNELYNIGLTDKKNNILRKIKDFNIGMSNINWSNQAVSFLRLNGLNFSFDLNKFTISAFAGISTDYSSIISLIKKDSIFDIKSGLNISYKWKPNQIFSIYSIINKTKNNSDSSNIASSLIASAGITYHHFFSENLNVLLESSFSKNMNQQIKQKIQNLLSSKIKFQKDNTTITAELLYKSKDFETNNFFFNPYDNIVANLQLSQKLLENKIQLTAFNTFSHNLFADLNNYNKTSNNIAISINLFLSKQLSLLLSSNFFLANNSANQKNDTQFSINISHDYNKKINDKLQFNLSKSLQFSYRLSNYIYYNQTPVIELNVLNYQEGKHINFNLNSSLSFNQKQTVLFNYNILHIIIPDAETNNKVNQFLYKIAYTHALSKISFEASALYIKNIQKNTTTHSYSPNINIQGNISEKIKIGALYQYFKNQVSIYQNTIPNNHLIRLNIIYKI
ncbi:MAG TPA: hypothetical protein VLZ75_07415 [Chitinophagales bacterium]|nr:hypothetical protein [Chitinophagales bacterium]